MVVSVLNSVFLYNINRKKSLSKMFKVVIVSHVFGALATTTTGDDGDDDDDTDDTMTMIPTAAD